MTGFAIGALTEVAFGDEIGIGILGDGQKAIAGGFSVSIFGAGLGALIGSAKIKIPIDGNFENYKKHLPDLKNYSINNRIK